jgi:hypothetical protein
MATGTSHLRTVHCLNVVVPQRFGHRTCWSSSAHGVPFRRVAPSILGCMRCFAITVALHVLILSLTGVSASAQQVGGGPFNQAPAPQAGSQQYSVSGLVVNAATGEPIPKALVQLNASPERITFSGPDGRFQIEGVPAGVAILTAQKPGFFSPQETGFEQTATPYPLIQIGRQSTDNIKVNLMPSGSISGHVTDGNGEPLEGIQVRAIYRQLINGRYHWQDRASANTDDTGAYHISSLIPGSYEIATVSRSTRQLASFQRPPKQDYDEVYPAVYYPGSPDLAAAAPLQVAAGEPRQADFTLTPQRAYQITGTVTGVSLERSSFTLFDRDGNQVFTPVKSDPKANQFRFYNVLPGDYTVKISTFGGPNEWLYGVAQVSVSASDVDNIAIEAFPAVTIQVQIETEAPSASGGRHVPLSVHLVPKEPNTEGGDIQSQPDPGQDQMHGLLVNVRPGRYRVEVEPLAQGYVSGLHSGGTDLSQQDLVVAPGGQPAPIQIVVHGSAASIQGVVKKDGSPVSQASILVVSDNPSPTAPTRLTASGTFTVSGLAPGAYHVYAFPSLAGIEYRNPEALLRYEQQASAVDLSENDTKQVEIQLITGIQP